MAEAVTVAVVVVAVAVAVVAVVAKVEIAAGCLRAAYGTDGANLRAGMAFLSSGCSPHARNPLLRCSGLNDTSHNCLIKPGKKVNNNST